MKVRILGNYTQDLILKHLGDSWKNSKTNIEFSVGGFNQYQQEILNKSSELYRLKPEVIFISIDLHNLLEDILYYSSQEEVVEDKIHKRVEEIFNIIELASSNLPDSTIFIDNFYFFRPVITSTLEYNYNNSIAHTFNDANANLTRLAKNMSNVLIVDVLSMIIHEGSASLFDERMYYLAKCQWGYNGIKKLSNLYSRYINAFIGARKKCVVVDLDNTLWGGIIGDDGMDNIVLSTDGEGKAYFDFQRELLKLHERGVMLAICSKNTLEIALNAIESHPHMLLRKEHFTAIRINWENKAQNIQEIAREINIGTDSIVFLDDSPVEREMVSNYLPDVFVPDLPADPSGYPNFLRSLHVFDYLTLTKDDLQRNVTYQANIERQQLQSQVENIEDFYFSLKMTANLFKDDLSLINRVAQMTQKTNQFNLRTIRYNESEIKRFIDSGAYSIYAISLADKFGDYGIIGSAIIRKDDQSAFIDTFVLSCRAFGRTVETALLNYIIDDLKSQKLPLLYGEFIKTSKNMPSESFFSDHAFIKCGPDKWQVNLNNYEKKNLPWMKIILNN